jgi:hypothetical protein
VTRFLDLFAILIVALLVLLPQPGIIVTSAVQGDKTDLDRLAILEDARFRAPNDAAAAVELARAYLRVEQPGWAVAALEPFFDRGEYLVNQVAAYAYATLLLPKEALKQAEQGLAACEAQGPRCPEVAHIRLQYLAGLMRQPATAGVDPALDPMRAKSMVLQALRATHSGVKPAAPTGPSTTAPTIPPVAGKAPALPSPAPK